MTMNRRDLLKKLAAAPVVAAVAPAVLAEAPRDFDTAHAVYVAHYHHVEYAQTFKIVDDPQLVEGVEIETRKERLAKEWYQKHFAERAKAHMDRELEHAIMHGDTHRLK